MVKEIFFKLKSFLNKQQDEMLTTFKSDIIHEFSTFLLIIQFFSVLIFSHLVSWEFFCHFLINLYIFLSRFCIFGASIFLNIAAYVSRALMDGGGGGLFSLKTGGERGKVLNKQ